MARNDRPPYFKVRRGRAYFELGRERAAQSGLKASIPLGLDNDRARASAWALYAEWREKSGKGDPVEAKPSYPKGSLGHFFERYREQRAWANKATTTREEWEYCWRIIEPVFGSRRINSITPAEVSDFQAALQEKGEYLRWRVIKIVRALFNAAVNHHVIAVTPAKAVTNPIPKGRREIWRAAEVVKLRQAAEQIGKPAMALAIWIAWETALAPIDVRKMTLGKRRRDGAGAWFESQRSKTAAVIEAAISPELDAAIDAYVEGLGVAIPPDQPFLRTSRDAHEYRKARFLTDFALTRAAAFGDDEKRRFQDIRRSANLEAELGGASPEERAEMLANRLDKDRSLDATYTPARVERSRKLAEKRAAGRRLLAVQSVNTTGEGVK
ncbi:MAG TPA: hypothetical protein PLV61_05915 [Parvularculaceae bacterium]|nr:hypothetical protein [Parvularculaceae bacterium]HRX38784.1 hypothetical protein [Parvularculaceae bacterium]